ncbi:sulfur carrier protein ThiS [Isoptericola dokdonensis]|jgi:sulfur carrier protein|uniref:Sulfur carrier protein ThiS n=1 Tax=Isoptericola dokdonensis DS-3 TaxID=1300344 RepID=A0A161I1G3_9MICO|nr:sulfur carrier protein ThiS [Isoptericola dokdonensis]ANC31095.1 sulfur carrier protein ThiS [Isoptericola dokdonensis DS-3]
MTAPPTALVNGAPYDLGAGGAVPVADVVAHLLPGHVVDGAPRGVAVAIDDVVVPRGVWDRTSVRAGDRVEIVTAVQGG